MIFFVGWLLSIFTKYCHICYIKFVEIYLSYYICYNAFVKLYLPHFICYITFMKYNLPLQLPPCICHISYKTLSFVTLAYHITFVILHFSYCFIYIVFVTWHVSSYPILDFSKIKKKIFWIHILGSGGIGGCT